MAGRTTVPDSARANAMLLRTAASMAAAGGAGGGGVREGAFEATDEALRDAFALVRLDQQQRTQCLDDRLSDERHTHILSLCG